MSFFRIWRKGVGYLFLGFLFWGIPGVSWAPLPGNMEHRILYR